MDEAHLVAALRYVSLNPVRAQLVARAEDWPWSSVTAHLSGRNDGVVTVERALERVGPFAAFLGESFDEAAVFAPLRQGEKTGRPIGADNWITDLERQFARALAPRKRGPKPKGRPAAGVSDLLSKLSP